MRQSGRKSGLAQERQGALKGADNLGDWWMLVKLWEHCAKVKLTMFFLLRQTLFGDLYISLSRLESLDSALGIMDRGSGGPDIEEL